jgi:hypothetical protein
MIESNTRTLGAVLASIVALVIVAQSAQHKGSVSAAVIRPPVAIVEKAPQPPVVQEAPVKKASQPMPIPVEKCGSTWVNGGNYILVTPKTCNDVSISSITVAVSAKPCEASTKADFVNLTNSTYFKGDYGFYLGQDKSVKCLAVKEIIGKYL